jgi:gamma-glutamyltranspeptidase / glutathione hydrolase
MHARTRPPSRTPGSWLATRLLALGLLFWPLSCDRQSPAPPQSGALPVEPAPKSIESIPASVDTGPDDGSAHRLPARAGQGTEVGVHGAVTSAEAHASDIGLEVLKKGGNAVDAAVAVAFALGVTHPSAGNIGGGGFMVIRLPDGTATTIDYREVAPLKAHRDMYLDKKGEVTRKSREGPLAAGIPGVVAGLAMAHEKFGSLPWKDLVMPAVALAREGWKLDSFHAEDMTWGTERMKALAEAATKENPRGALARGYAATLATFLKSDGSAYQTDELWKQPELADTLEAIANQGPGAFYRGPLARKMAESVKAMGGIWTEKDLAEYRAIEREPLTFEYRGHGIITMPPPSAGGVVLRHVLAASEVLGLHELPWMSIERIHLYVEALRRIYADRNFLIGDPAFVEIPMKKLLDVSYMSQRMADVDRSKATPSSQVGTGIQYKESSQTTHFSVVDKNRMAVSNTYTLNGGFGAKLLIPGTGVILNNEMDDFTAKVGAPNMFGLVQGPQNSIAPKKRMLSSMTPTIVTRDGKLRAVVGSPGGPTISTTVAQIIMQLIDHEVTLSEAVASPRIHHQWLPDRIWHEPLDESVIAALEKLGHAHVERGSIGHANSIEIDPETGGLRAVADVIRDGGKAAAY